MTIKTLCTIHANELIKYFAYFGNPFAYWCQCLLVTIEFVIRKTNGNYLLVHKYYVRRIEKQQVKITSTRFANDFYMMKSKSALPLMGHLLYKRRRYNIIQIILSKR
jgi:hypothetical protein